MGNIEQIRFDGRVALVTGAGTGLGRDYALALAQRGAKIVVNDLGANLDGRGRSSQSAQSVVAEILAAGGEALASGANVADEEEVAQMVAAVRERWGRIDVLINNAGIIRDRSFQKMTRSEFCSVLDVHLLGSVNTTAAVWPLMREQAYGRVVMTTSISGLYGNFGQANYSAAKMALIGLMNTLQIEGRKYGIHVNTISPGAYTRMADSVIDDTQAQLMAQNMKCQHVTPAVIYLCAEQAPKAAVLLASGRVVSRAYIAETEGVLMEEEQLTPEAIGEHFQEISDPDSLRLYGSIEERDRIRFSHLKRS